MEKMIKMINGKNLDDAMESYEKIRSSLVELFDIINITIPEQDFFHGAAIDNLKILNENMIELLKQTNTPREVRMRLRELEFDEKEAETDFPL